MSFSFTVTGKTKAEVINKVADELNKVVDLQPTHADDKELALKHAQNVLDQVTETDDARDFAVSVNGSVSKSETFGTTSLSIGASAWLCIREQAE